MDIAIIIAIVGTGIAMVGVVISMMFWVRTEANALRSEAKGEANALRSEAKGDRKDMLSMVKAIETEMKDFHVQLLLLDKKHRRGDK